MTSELRYISPFFIVSSVPESLRFYATLGFETRFSEGIDGGPPFFAIAGRGPVQIFLKDLGIPAQPNASRHPWSWDAFVYAADPDALAAEFSSNGIVFHKEILDREDGLRGFEILDPDGYLLFFGRLIQEN